jgi:lysophospholipase
MLGLPIGKAPHSLLRAVTAPARRVGFGTCRLPGTRRFQPDQPPTPERSRASSDAVRCRVRHAWLVTEPRLRLDQPTYGWLDPALGLISHISRPRFLRAIDTPMLLGSAGREVVVSSLAHHRAASHLPDCTLVELSESKHEPFMECDAIREAWFGHIERFAATRLPGFSARSELVSNRRRAISPAAL